MLTPPSTPPRAHAPESKEYENLIRENARENPLGLPATEFKTYLPYLTEVMRDYHACRNAHKYQRANLRDCHLLDAAIREGSAKLLLGKKGTLMAKIKIKDYGWITVTIGQDQAPYIHTNRKDHPNTIGEHKKYIQIIHDLREDNPLRLDPRVIQDLLELSTTHINTPQQKRAAAHMLGILAAEEIRCPGSWEYAMRAFRMTHYWGDPLETWRNSFLCAKKTEAGRQRMALLDAIASDQVTDALISANGGHTVLQDISHILPFITPPAPKRRRFDINADEASDHENPLSDSENYVSPFFNLQIRRILRGELPGELVVTV